MSNGPAIVIEGECPSWPGGTRTLNSLEPNREPTQTYWFGAELAPGDNEVWFQITYEAIRRMREDTPQSRGARLVECLIAWLGEDPERQLDRRNHFLVLVDDTGTRIEPYGD